MYIRFMHVTFNLTAVVIPQLSGDSRRLGETFKTGHTVETPKQNPPARLAFKSPSVFFRVAVISAKKHKRQRRKRQSVTAKREKSRTPKVLTAILTLPNLT